MTTTTTSAPVPWSRPLEDAVRCRSSGTGLVPMIVLRLLTRDEWDLVRTLGRARAQQILEYWEGSAPRQVPDGTRR